MKYLLNVIRLAMILALGFVLVYSGKNLYESVGGYLNSDKAYDSIQEAVQTPTKEEKKDQDVKEDNNNRTEEDVEAAQKIQVDFDKLSKINEDIVGWIYAEDTSINYPVVQGKDNSYYLNHMYDGKENSSGSIFLDYENSSDFSDQNSIIYGHHMKNGTMFKDIANYKEQDYYKTHKTLELVTPKAHYTIYIFAGYVTKDDDSETWRTHFSDQEEWEEWIQERKHKSCFRSDYKANPEQNMITLSTCSYEYEDARFVLYGFMEED